MPVLKARIGGAWVNVGGGTDEVSIGTAEPVDPNIELWYDTDDPGVSFPNAFGPWTAFTPTFTQSVTITKTVLTATYMQIGKLVICQVAMNATSAGTATNAVRVGLPIAARASNAVFGVGQLYDASTTTRYICGMFGMSATEVAFGINGVSSDVWGNSPNLAIASGDQMNYTVTYEAA